MLILTRKSGESIQIGNEIKITILEIRGRQVRVGIEAPDHTIVHREEVYKKIQQENILAASLNAHDLNEITRFWNKNGKSR